MLAVQWLLDATSSMLSMVDLPKYGPLIPHYFDRSPKRIFERKQQNEGCKIAVHCSGTVPDRRSISVVSSDLSLPAGSPPVSEGFWYQRLRSTCYLGTLERFA